MANQSKEVGLSPEYVPPVVIPWEGSLSDLQASATNTVTNVRSTTYLREFLPSELRQTTDHHNYQRYSFHYFAMWLTNGVGFTRNDDIILVGQPEVKYARRIVHMEDWQQLLFDVVHGKVHCTVQGAIYFWIVKTAERRAQRGHEKIFLGLSQLIPDGRRRIIVPLQLESGSETDSLYGESIDTKSEAGSTEMESPEPEAEIEDLDLSAEGAAVEDDYGAIDDNIVDCNLPAFNHCGHDKQWRPIVELFGTTWDEALKKESQNKTRTPFKKLPGMQLGVYDYQLVAVYKLLELTAAGSDLSGAILADEPGTGKTLVMLAVAAMAQALRKNKADVEDDKKPGKMRRHGPRGGIKESCKLDMKLGFKCSCYHEPTRKLADSLRDGPTLVLVPQRSVKQWIQEATDKLANTEWCIRTLPGKGGKGDATTLKPEEIKRLPTSVRKSKPGAQPEYYYEVSQNKAANNMIIIVPFHRVGELSKLAGTSLKALPKGGQVAKVTPHSNTDGFYPALVLMDEFHEEKAGSESMAFLQRIVAGSKQDHPAPRTFFASGTPFGESPAELKAALSIFSRNAAAHVNTLDHLANTFDALLERQNDGEDINLDEVKEYRRDIGNFLQRLMVRRLGTDSFRGKKLTNVGPLRVNIVNHPVPEPYTDAIQKLSDRARATAKTAVESGEARTVTGYLRCSKGEAALLPLRLASTFPATANTSLEDEVIFTEDAIRNAMAASGNRFDKTPYFPRIAEWTRNSPKLKSLRGLIDGMLKDVVKPDKAVTSHKKMVIFAPVEAEAMVIFGYLLRCKADDAAFRPLWLHSNRSEAERADDVERFREESAGACNILVSTTTLSGTGLNLQAAKYEVITGLGWTKNENQQAYFRIHRSGQIYDTDLSLLTSMGNPADRRIQARYAGQSLPEGDDAWRVTVNAEDVDKNAGLIDRHNEAK